MTADPQPSGPIGYFWGDDAYSIERAAERLARRVAGPGGEPLRRWRTTGATGSPATIGERVATGAMFGGGTLALVSDPGPLLRSKAVRDELLGLLPWIAEGNALVFLDPMDRLPKTLDAGRTALVEAVRLSGGETRTFQVPREGGMAHWIEERARERGLRLGPGAARELGRRVGAFVREGDIDRRRQVELAASELDKLAIYRLDGEIGIDDVRALAPEAVPASGWALLDAVGSRRSPEAGTLIDRVLDVTPEPVLIVQLHRRLRELIEVSDLLASGKRPAELPRLLGLHPFRAETLVRQAGAWTMPELEAALDGLLAVDGLIKGAGRTMASERMRRLGFTLWVADRVAPRVSSAQDLPSG